MPEERLSYSESCDRLKPNYISKTPPQRKTMPRHDDEEPGLSFFKTFVGDGDDFSNLTIPKTYLGRCEVTSASFRNTDLSQSYLCWNDFVNVDFSEADLSQADMRGSLFKKINFGLANLKGSDLRCSTFKDCCFNGADLKSAVVSRSQRSSMNLSPEQRKAIDWRWRKGPVPDGG
ncbi:MAG: pentapeptide repeat-containing protein [Woeseiaceae bacterium]